MQLHEFYSDELGNALVATHTNLPQMLDSLNNIIMHWGDSLWSLTLYKQTKYNEAAILSNKIRVWNAFRIVKALYRMFFAF